MPCSFKLLWHRHILGFLEQKKNRRFVVKETFIFKITFFFFQGCCPNRSGTENLFYKEIFLISFSSKVSPKGSIFTWTLNFQICNCDNFNDIRVAGMSIRASGPLSNKPVENLNILCVDIPKYCLVRCPRFNCFLVHPVNLKYTGQMREKFKFTIIIIKMLNWPHNKCTLRYTLE